MSSSYDSSDDSRRKGDGNAMAMHAKKRPKHGGFILGRQKLWRERIEAHERAIFIVVFR
jgi:hypothetical protein